MGTYDIFIRLKQNAIEAEREEKMLMKKWLQRLTGVFLCGAMLCGTLHMGEASADTEE